jgi:hypothetical protein
LKQQYPVIGYWASQNGFALSKKQLGVSLPTEPCTVSLVLLQKLTFAGISKVNLEANFTSKHVKKAQSGVEV